MKKQTQTKQSKQTNRQTTQIKKLLASTDASIIYQILFHIETLMIATLD
jgi:hypothetical protein